MYTLKEWWNISIGEDPVKDWDGKVYCTPSNAEMTMQTNLTQGFLSCYTFTLVTEGWLTMNYNGIEIHLTKGDLYIYSPGLSVTILSISQDYRSYCLMVDEHTTLETPSIRDMVSMAYLPIVQLSEPKLSLPQETAALLESRMREIINYLHSDNTYKQQVLRMLYAIFLLDLQNAQDRIIVQRHVPQRIEEIFIGFNRLLPLHFVEHHDIGFYADRLHITSDYLSRVVKRVTGRTVIDYINQMLLMEASFLLRTSKLSIAQIGQRLNFADAPSFTKFFSRLKGMTPKEYREG
jgi:AraC-like DNA-binding protein